MSISPAIIWFRRDLRLADNPALVRAIASGRPIIPLYILDETVGRPLGGASRWWLHFSLNALDQALNRLGGALIRRRGPAGPVLDALIRATGACAVYWNRAYDADSIARDRSIKQTLTDQGLISSSSNASLLFEPWTIRNKAGGPYRVFSQFWRACQAAPPPPTPLPAPTNIHFAPRPESETLQSWGLTPTTPDWAGGLRQSWQPGEASARERLARFLDDDLAAYAEARDRPDQPGTSRLSPHLSFGEISPGQIWHALEASPPGSGPQSFLRELGWREFSYHLLFDQPDLARLPLRAEFNRFPWQPDADLLRAWQRGQTGFPLVDAGMRQLWATGWMHNRVRMVTASFLVKHLLQPWQQGESWFWDCLVDADPAANAASWQWVTGCGADAAPYFRIFNPVLQGQKFDPDGHYVRHWIPELAKRPLSALHQPWTIADFQLLAASDAARTPYIKPVTEHTAARTRALAAYAEMAGKPG